MDPDLVLRQPQKVFMTAILCAATSTPQAE